MNKIRIVLFPSELESIKMQLALLHGIESKEFNEWINVLNMDKSGTWITLDVVQVVSLIANLTKQITAFKNACRYGVALPFSEIEVETRRITKILQEALNDEL